MIFDDCAAFISFLLGMALTSASPRQVSALSASCSSEGRSGDSQLTVGLKLPTLGSKGSHATPNMTKFGDDKQNNEVRNTTLRV